MCHPNLHAVDINRDYYNIDRGWGLVVDVFEDLLQLCLRQDLADGLGVGLVQPKPSAFGPRQQAKKAPFYLRRQIDRSHAHDLPFYRVTVRYERRVTYLAPSAQPGTLSGRTAHQGDLHPAENYPGESDKAFCAPPV